MKIWTLLENTSCREDLQAEHGLSLYVETGKHRILFDAGQSSAFAENAEKMGVDLSQVDMAILSHGHYDHGGGMMHFLEINDKAPIYVNRNAFGAFYHGPGKYIGLDPQLCRSDRLVLTDDLLTVDAGLTLHSCSRLGKPYPAAGRELSILENGVLREDDFAHEQYLLVEENEKKVLFSGCSHRGILNIESWFRPDVLVGGFHFKNLEIQGTDREELEQAAQVLLQCPTRYYTCHCTGQRQYLFLKKYMGERLEYLHTGTVCRI